MRFSRQRICPYCTCEELARLPRPGWLLWLPQSRMYECLRCRRDFVRLIFGKDKSKG